MGGDSLIASLNGTFSIYNTTTSLTSAENPLNQQKYICGEFNISKLINALTEQVVSFITKIMLLFTESFMIYTDTFLYNYYQYGCRIDEFEEDKRNSNYKIRLISPKATIYLNRENFKIVTTDNQTRIKLTKILVEQLIVL